MGGSPSGATPFAASTTQSPAVHGQGYGFDGRDSVIRYLLELVRKSNGIRHMRAVIDSISLLDILAALPPSPVPGGPFQPRGGNLSFYRPQSEWLNGAVVSTLPFTDYEAGLRQIVDRFGGDGASVEIPQINAAAGPLPKLSISEAEMLRAYYWSCPVESDEGTIISAV